LIDTTSACLEFFLLLCFADIRYLPSFPTRRSSDLDLAVMRRYCQESPKYFHKSFLTKLTEICENFMTWSAALKNQAGMSFFDAELQPILLNLCHLRRKKTDFQPTTQVFNKSCPDAEQQLILQH